VSWVSLEHYVGPEAEDPGAKAVLLSFFASWCGPCKKEMPYLQKLHQKYMEQGLRIISVDIDKEEAGIDAAKKMAAANKVTYPVASDRFNFLARRYLGDQSPLPSVFIILRDGTIARIEKGYGKDVSTFIMAEVQKALQPAAGSPAPKGQ
jgi:thiol-disulfide isomerase/thioredoxin